MCRPCQSGLLSYSHPMQHQTRSHWAPHLNQGYLPRSAGATETKRLLHRTCNIEMTEHFPPGPDSAESGAPQVQAALVQNECDKECVIRKSGLINPPNVFIIYLNGLLFLRLAL